MKIFKIGSIIFAVLFIVLSAPSVFALEGDEVYFNVNVLSDVADIETDTIADIVSTEIPDKPHETDELTSESQGEEPLAFTDHALSESESPFVLLNTEEHIKYIDGKNNGLFQPNASITRAETAKIIYMLLLDKPISSGSVFTDVPIGKWYTEYVNVLASLKILQGSGGKYRPDSHITRAEFVTIVSRFYPLEDGEINFTDVSENHWAKSSIISSTIKGWVDGYGNGTFRPENKITRAEAVTIVNRVMKRSGDREAIEEMNYRLFPDVTPAGWFYSQIMEAAVSHGHEFDEESEIWLDHSPPQTILSPGFHSIGGELYHVNDELLFSHDVVIQGLPFAYNCTYTTGDRELDSLLTAIVSSQSSGSQSREQLLNRVFIYTRDRFEYFVRPHIAKGSTGWENMRALEMIKTGKGNCYSFAATFYHLARKLGYDATTIIGSFSTGPHSWVEIVFNGKAYVFDTQIEKRYHSWGDYTYNFFKATYDELPDLYKK